MRWLDGRRRLRDHVFIPARRCAGRFLKGYPRLKRYLKAIEGRFIAVAELEEFTTPAPSGEAAVLPRRADRVARDLRRAIRKYRAGLPAEDR